jgi:hypothetical protein
MIFLEELRRSPESEIERKVTSCSVGRASLMSLINLRARFSRVWPKFLMSSNKFTTWDEKNAMIPVITRKTITKVMMMEMIRGT